MTARIELGIPGWSLEPVESSVADPPTRIVGYIEHHPDRESGVPCRGFLVTDRSSAGSAGSAGRPAWTVTQLEPITLAPSIACRTCGRHYYVRAGRVELAEG